MAFGLPEIYYVLFRRKWFIVAGAILGLGAAVFLWKTKQPLFQSEAKLLVKYVLENRSLVGVVPEAQVRGPDSSGANIIKSELQILNSFDVARDVATVVTPERILAGVRSTGDASAQSAQIAAAAGLIKRNLQTDNPNNGWILALRFEHADPAVAQQVLEQVIAAYFKKHREIHRSNATLDDNLIGQREQLRSQLAQTEERLKQLKTKIGVVSVEDAKKTHFENTQSLMQDLRSAEAELALRTATLAEIRKTTPGDVAASVTNAAAPSVETPRTKTQEYRKVCADIERLETRETALLQVFTLENPQTRTNHIQLEEARSRRAALEKQYPELLLTPLPSPGGSLASSTTPGNDSAALNYQIIGLAAKVKFLTNQLAAVRADAQALEEHENEINSLERKRAGLDKMLAHADTSLQQAGFDQDLANGKSANISRIQEPTPPARNFKDLYKKIVMALFGGCAAGVGLAFLWELFVNRTVKRPKDVEGLMDAPNFLSIPVLKLGPTTKPAKLLPAKGVANSKVVDSVPRTESEMVPFHEALRDRLVTYFEVRDMTHKPKMIAVTSCAEGAGVSSVASGLAASLSETGDGNVLLVDMRGERGAAHAFFHGKPAVGLDQALENETRTNARVDENLYVVSTSSSSAESNLHRIVPKKFSHLVPKLKASDYDYIIFDMPPVAQTSITAKVARFMDMVLMVVESDKTDREVVKRAGNLLAESKATVATVLNKRRRYVPAWLQQEFH